MTSLNKKDGACRFVEFMEDCARSALSPINDKVLHQEDRKSLEYVLASLPLAFEFLSASMRPSGATHTAVHDAIRTALHQVMACSFITGQKSGVTKSAKTFFASKQAELASGVAAIKNRERRLSLQTAIKEAAEEKKKTLAISIEFARMIRPDVMDKLAISPEGENEKTKWSSPATIKNEIARIKSTKSSRLNLTSAKS